MDYWDESAALDGLAESDESDGLDVDGFCSDASFDSSFLPSDCSLAEPSALMEATSPLLLMHSTVLINRPFTRGCAGDTSSQIKDCSQVVAQACPGEGMLAMACD